MLKYKDRFDDRLIRERSERIAGLPHGSDSAKVRIGKVGQHYDELPPEISDEIDAIWHEEITPVLGFENYEAFAAQVVAGGVHFA